ncbi:MAG: tetratricopeptide repeat protein [Deltaproteobacteria bacterium]|nr:tetratricopeptide repeat protein [Deltaproteobacteria bacterium]
MLSFDDLRRFEEVLKAPFRRALEVGRVELLPPPVPDPDHADPMLTAVAKGKAAFDEGTGRLLLPLFEQGRFLAILQIFDVQAGQLGPQARPFLTAVMEAALELVRLRLAAEKDPLTGLANEHALEEAVIREASRLAPSRSRGRPVLDAAEQTPGIFLLAIRPGGLPLWQHRFGRRFGQRILKEAAWRVAEGSGGAISAARLGEAFFLLAGGGREEARRMASRVLEKVGGLELSPGPGAEAYRPALHLGAAILEPGEAGGVPAAEAAAMLLVRAQRALGVAGRAAPGQILFYADILEEAGRVKEVRPLNQVVIDLGRADGLAEGERFRVVAPGDNAQVKAEILVSKVGEEESLAEVASLGGAAPPLAPGDRLRRLPRRERAALEPGPEEEIALGSRRVRVSLDESTGLVSRRSFMSLFAELASEAEAFSVVLARVEGLEGTREISGQVGAEALMKSLARAGREVFPPGAGLGLFFPDTIAALLPGLKVDRGLELALAFLSRVRREVERPVRAGVAGHPLEGFQPAEVLDNAAKALVHAGFLEPFEAAGFDAVSLNISGDRLFDQGRLSEAVAEYERALVLSPQEPNVLNSLGVCYGQLGQAGRAMEFFQKAQAASPDDFMAYYNLGCAFLAKERLTEAREQLTLALEKNPQHADTVFQMGRLNQMEGRLLEARDLFLRAAGLPGCRVAVHRHLGEVHMALGRVKEAEESFNRAVKANPRDAAGLSGLAALYLDRGANREIALSLARRAVALAPEEPRGRRVLARALAETGRGAEATEILTRAVAELPGDPYLALMLGRDLAAQGRVDEARRQFQAALKLEPGLEEARQELAGLKAAAAPAAPAAPPSGD